MIAAPILNLLDLFCVGGGALAASKGYRQSRRATAERRGDGHNRESDHRPHVPSLPVNNDLPERDRRLLRHATMVQFERLAERPHTELFMGHSAGREVEVAHHWQAKLALLPTPAGHGAAKIGCLQSRGDADIGKIPALRSLKWACVVEPEQDEIALAANAPRRWPAAGPRRLATNRRGMLSFRGL